MARELLVLQVEHLDQIEARITALDGRLVRQAREDEAGRRLTEAPAMVATVGDARLFSSGPSLALPHIGKTRRRRSSARTMAVGQRG